ncbi:MAG: hypothetical protein QW328_05105 [Nitrososphaerota archaeon]
MTEGEEKPKLGPFIAGLYIATVRSGEAAESILREEGEKLTPKQKAYLEHVIEEGKRPRSSSKSMGYASSPSSLKNLFSFQVKTVKLRAVAEYAREGSGLSRNTW